MNKLYLLLIAVIAYGCGTSKQVVDEVIIEEEYLDTLMVTAPAVVADKDLPQLPVYNAAATRTYDILHTALDLSFDWDKEEVIGQADIKLTPIFYPIEEVILDAKNFVINTVASSGRSLSYKYEDDRLAIKLPKSLKRGEQVTLTIDYIARPSQNAGGGSAAISGDQGLYFINPRGEVEGKPTQIWTQGETESNSKWFPTFDKPNERMSQEITLTVDDKLTTLSNGLLVSSKKNTDGTRTDHWKQDKGHTPYLAMVAIGDFATVKEKVDGLEYAYIVDPPYEDDAKAIFNHTPEMVKYFSELLDYPFPWDKYSQIVVEDFVSGAMENTSASIFGDFVQKNRLELIDNGNDNIVAHELFHQWFGNLVTTESWANLTLNEGFANYSEYLWKEHKYGKYDAEAHRLSEMMSYFRSTDGGDTHPLIHYGYDDREEMFDTHSYNKGGLVLHMLRQIVGDEAFFASLSKYLHDNEYTAVEVDELRMAFEDTTGLDLNWFFDQWYHNAGHPEINVSYDYDDISDELKITYEQIQKKDHHKEIFVLPVDIAIYDNQGKVRYEPVILDKRRDTITIRNTKEKPMAVVLDGKRYLLAKINQDISQDQALFLIKHSKEFLDKVYAFRQLDREQLKPLAGQLLEEPFHEMKQLGIDLAEKEQVAKLERLALEDGHSGVRAFAAKKLRLLDYQKGLAVAKKILSTDLAPLPYTEALTIINEENPDQADQEMNRLLREDESSYTPYLASLMAYKGDQKFIPIIRRNLNGLSYQALPPTFMAYKDLVVNAPEDVMLQEANHINDLIAKTDQSYVKILSFDILKDMIRILKERNGKNDIIKNLQDKMDDIIENEPDEEVKRMLRE